MIDNINSAPVLYLMSFFKTMSITHIRQSTMITHQISKFINKKKGNLRRKIH